jgi:hypothetical protein
MRVYVRWYDVGRRDRGGHHYSSAFESAPDDCYCSWKSTCKSSVWVVCVAPTLQAGGIGFRFEHPDET